MSCRSLTGLSDRAWRCERLRTAKTSERPAASRKRKVRCVWLRARSLRLKATERPLMAYPLAKPLANTAVCAFETWGDVSCRREAVIDASLSPTSTGKVLVYPAAAFGLTDDDQPSRHPRSKLAVHAGNPPRPLNVVAPGVIDTPAVPGSCQIPTSGRKWNGLRPTAIAATLPSGGGLQNQGTPAA
jgi:hypothetical protein